MIRAEAEAGRWLLQLVVASRLLPQPSLGASQVGKLCLYSVSVLNNTPTTGLLDDFGKNAVERSLAASASFCSGVEPRKDPKVPSKHFADDSREEAQKETNLSGFMDSVSLTGSTVSRFCSTDCLFLPRLKPSECETFRVVGIARDWSCQQTSLLATRRRNFELSLVAQL